MIDWHITISPDNNVISKCNGNTILKTMTYNVELEDFYVKDYMAKIIAENILSRTDSDRHVTTALETILNHRKDDTSYDLQDRCVYSMVKKTLFNLHKGGISKHYENMEL